MVGGGVNRHIRGCRIGFGETHLERGECMSKNWGAEVILPTNFSFI